MNIKYIMAGKKITHIIQNKDKIVKGLSQLAEPVIGTLTPQGQNVIYEDQVGRFLVSNDGVTIANQIELEDPDENAVAQLVRQAALSTNAAVGDGTTTSILLAKHLILEGLKLIESGWNPMRLKRELEVAAKVILSEINKLSYKVKGIKDLEFIAKVSANNDEEIAKNVVEAVGVTGVEGMVVIEMSNKEGTELIKEEGFTIGQGMFSPLLANQKGKFEAVYHDVKVLVTDKRIYYPQEALAILEPLAKEGVTDVVIIAKDFIGQAPNIFITNHSQKRMNILLVKDPDVTEKSSESLEDLASYLGTKVVTDKAGKLTWQVGLADFGTAKRVISNNSRTLIFGNAGVSMKMRFSPIKKELEPTPKEIEKEALTKR